MIADTYMVLINMRKSFSFLWDEYGFKLVGLMPRSGYRDSGYFAQLENEWCLVAFQSESGFLENIGVVPKGGSSEGEFVGRWALLSTGEKEKPLQRPYTDENVFNSFAEFAHPYLVEMLELAKNPTLFEQRLKGLKEVSSSNKITIEMIRAERARLHHLGWTLHLVLQWKICKKEANMNNPGIKEDIWIVLNQKWDQLTSEGHTVKVEFKILQSSDRSKTLAIDVAQNIDGEWVVQTDQHQAQEAYPAIGIEGFGLDQLINTASRVVNSVTEPITGHKTYDEMHIYMK